MLPSSPIRATPSTTPLPRPVPSSPSQSLSIGNQNIWTADYFTNGTMASVLANLTPAATPTYTTSGLVITPVNATFTPSTAIKPIGVVVDASGNAWYGIVGNPANTTTTTGVEEVTPSFTSSVITSLNPQAEVANATLGAQATGIPSIDGAGTIYLSDNIGCGSARHSRLLHGGGLQQRFCIAGAVSAFGLPWLLSGHFYNYDLRQRHLVCRLQPRAKPRSTALAPSGLTFRPRAA